MKILILALCSLPLMAADLLPLATGNQWTYRVSDGTTKNITVGLPLAAGGKVYYRVAGYAATAPLWLRSDATGVFMYDDETAQDVELVRFASGPINTPISGCLQSQEARPGFTRYEGPTGRFDSGVELRYRPLGCRDVGFENEIYLDNIGLVKRTETTFAGPKTMELIYAKVGEVTVEPGKQTSLSLTLDKPVVTAILPGDSISLKATLRLTVAEGGALKLTFPTSQRYDLAVRDTNGQTVYLWSSLAIFLPVVGTEQISGQRTWEIDVNVPGLPPGNYQVEAWLTTVGERILAVATPLQVTNVN
jgi:hypothetical protein